MKRNRIIYVGNFLFPDGNAAGKRVLANGYILRDLGFEVVFVGMKKGIESSQSILLTKAQYHGFHSYNLPYPRTSVEWLNYPRIFRKFLELIEEEHLEDGLAAVFSYGSPAVAAWNLKILSWCRQRGIKYIEDCVDWLSVSHGNVLFRIAKWLDYTFKKTHVNSKADGVVAVSSFLKDYYSSKGCRSVVIPPLSVHEADTDFPDTDNGSPVQILYAGIPFQPDGGPKDPAKFKDRLDKAILYLYEAHRRGLSFVFHIYGISRDDLVTTLPELNRIIDEMGSSIHFGGSLCNSQVMNRIRDADFTLLIRDDNKATRAGFPTKVSESISCGTPVITTRTSDLECYLVEGEQVHWVSLDYTDAVEDVIAALSISKSDIRRMKRLSAACGAFHYRRFVGAMRAFLIAIGILQ